MNERITETDLKYNNKLKLEAIIRSYNLLVEQKNILKNNVDKLYNLILIYINNIDFDTDTVQQQLINIQKDALYVDDILVADAEV